MNKDCEKCLYRKSYKQDISEREKLREVGETMVKVLENVILPCADIVKKEEGKIDDLYEMAKTRKGALCSRPAASPSATSCVDSEARNEHRKRLLQDITGRFRFTQDQLGWDFHQARITNERLGNLFRKCLGVGSYPSKSQKEAMEGLWTILAGKRENAKKEPREDFYRQTVLNIIGYFKTKGLLLGENRKLVRAVFPDASEGMVRNVSREISSHVFPEGTHVLLDYYIQELMDGRF